MLFNLSYCVYLYLVFYIFLSSSNYFNGFIYASSTGTSSGTSVADLTPCTSILNPSTADECIQAKVSGYTCCYVNVESVNGNKTFCTAVEEDFNFVPPFITEYYEGSNTYLQNAEYECSSTAEKETCSMNHPKTLNDCIYDGSSETSCCMITYRNGDTNCILSNEHKFGYNVTNFTLWDNVIQCSSDFMNYSLSITVLSLVLIFYV